MQKQWKALVKECLAPHPEYVDVGMKLAVAANFSATIVTPLRIGPQAGMDSALIFLQSSCG
jgi:hypothetical protein